MLATPDRGRLYVMQPVRCGMQGGTVRFSEWGEGPRGRRGGLMRDAKEHLRNGVLAHPDALLIAAAPEMAAALDCIVRRLQLYVDDGSRPDQWTMEDLIRTAKKALPHGLVIGAA